jgi:PAS domain S-box-containing protein
VGAPYSDALFRGVFEAVPDAVLVVDDDGRIVVANEQCREVFGRDPEDLVGDTVDTLVPHRFRGGHPRRRDHYGAAPRPRPLGLLRLSASRADGTEFPAEISLAALEADGRRFIATTVRDITVRVRDEERFRNLLEGAPDPTLIVDAAADIVLANDRLCSALGHRREDLVGRSITVLAAEPGPDEVLTRIADYLRAPSVVPMGQSDEFRVRAADGREVPMEISLSPVQTTEGLLVSIALRDVSERRRIEAESQRLRDELIATVSHELRTPLASIIGYAELLADLDEPDVSDRARRLVKVIERNAQRELKLVDDLLTMAYLDDNRLPLHRAPADLLEVCRGVVADAGLRARERGLSLVLTPPERPLRPVLADVFRLVQVIENLLTNALKFTGPGGTVEVRLADGGGQAVLEVSDTGIGVDADERERVFERLYRAPGAVARQTQGAGLGLSIVRAIVEAHHGTIEVDSEPGVGTVFRVGIPYAAGAAAEVPAAG